MLTSCSVFEFLYGVDDYNGYDLSEGQSRAEPKEPKEQKEPKEEDEEEYIEDQSGFDAQGLASSEYKKEKPLKKLRLKRVPDANETDTNGTKTDEKR